MRTGIHLGAVVGLAPILMACGSGPATSDASARLDAAPNGTDDGARPGGELFDGGDGGTAIWVRDVLAPHYTAGEVCLYSSDPSQPFLASGLLDVSLRYQYDAVYLAANLLPPQSPSGGGVDPSTITIQGATVRITSTSNSPLASYTRLTSAAISPFVGSASGYAPIFVTIVDPRTILTDPDIQPIFATPLGAPDRVRLQTYVRFFGTTLNGQSASSGEFLFAVDVCNGCLINFNNDPASPTPNCIGGVPGDASSRSIPCLVGQDLRIDCDLCSASSVSCRGYQGGTDGGRSD